MSTKIVRSTIILHMMKSEIMMRGPRGYTALLQVADGYIQNKTNKPGDVWANLVPLAVLKGDKGDNSHLHIKWHAEGSEILLDTPDAYIGIYADNEIADSEAYADYTWYKYKGEQGNPAPNTIFQYSVNGTDWTDAATGAQWYKQSGDNGTTWSEAIAISTTAYADAKVADAINNGTTGIAPSQNAVFDALALKAPLVSPALTGTPTAPTVTQGTNTTQIATTAFVDSATMEGDPA